MAKVKYRYNHHTLSYDKIHLNFRHKLFRAFIFLGASFVMGIIIYGITYTFIDSPKEKHLKLENAQLKSQYTLLNKRLDESRIVLNDIENRDDNIYRVIFEAEPIPDEIREAGIGGVNRYEELEGYDDAKLVIETTKNLDKLSKELYIQSKSFDEVYKLAKNKKLMLAHLPAIQPVQNKDLKRVASGYGWRMHPILKYRKFHAGMDFTAPIGTPIYATGDGVVTRADNKASGFGNHVEIDHGYHYSTLYAHMSKIACIVGQKIKRGDVIGYVGNTGLSTGPHCHYEVHKNGEPVDPVNYYYNDLTPNEYAKMIELANDPTQSFD